MPVYYLFITVLFIMIYLIRFFILRKKNISEELFMEALKNENSGNFEKAIITYENALSEAKKVRFQRNNLKNKIIEKLKVLNTVIAYKNNFYFTSYSM